MQTIKYTQIGLFDFDGVRKRCDPSRRFGESRPRLVQDAVQRTKIAYLGVLRDRSADLRSKLVFTEALLERQAEEAFETRENQRGKAFTSAVEKKLAEGEAI